MMLAVCLGTLVTIELHGEEHKGRNSTAKCLFFLLRADGKIRFEMFEQLPVQWPRYNV